MGFEAEHNKFDIRDKTIQIRPNPEKNGRDLIVHEPFNGGQCVGVWGLCLELLGRLRLNSVNLEKIIYCAPGRVVIGSEEPVSFPGSGSVSEVRLDPESGFVSNVRIRIQQKPLKQKISYRIFFT